MSVDPTLVPFETFAELRPQRAVPPLVGALWLAGSFEGLRRPAVAIVGTRAATAYGKATAARFARDLTAAGCCVISGLALGIDAAAHKAALEAGGITIGVLGSGHGQFFPMRNRALAQAMIDGGGAVVSQFAPEEQAWPGNFLKRNGIVAALSDAVVVIEAPARSGALNTASWAAPRIPVLAVPGDIDRAHVAGCHALIRDGATLARSAADVLEQLRLPQNAPAETALEAAQREECPVEDPLHAGIIEALRAGECSVDELIDRTHVPAARLTAALSLLELRGAVQARAGARYALAGLALT